MNNNYVRLVRNDEGVIVESHDADHEFKALRDTVVTQQTLITDLRELLDQARKIALEAVEKTIKENRA